MSENKHYILVSGGRFSKVYGRNQIFLELIRTIVTKYDNLSFVFIGNGNSATMQKFINRHNLKEKWTIIPYRNDLPAFLSSCDIYISTFPMFGGLMTQTAAFVGLPIVELDSKTGNFSEDVLPFLDGCNITFGTQAECIDRVGELINDDKLR